MNRRHVAFAAVAATFLAAAPAFAQQVTLRAVNAFPEGTYFARNFEAFVARVNEGGKGLVQINYVGGPKSIPTLEQGTALRNGVVDMANSTSSFLTGIVPEALALHYTPYTTAQLRASGAIERINTIFEEKGLHYFARSSEGFQMHVYSNKPITGTDLGGMRIRGVPSFKPFFAKLNANMINIPPGEVYTALERGVVDGYGWPLMGIFDLGWQERTRYRVDPGFYNVEVSIYFNLAAWRRLTPPQREFLEKQREWLENANLQAAAKDIPAEREKQEKAGIQVIRFPAADEQRYLKMAYDSAWDGLIEVSPKNGPMLRSLFVPK